VTNPNPHKSLLTPNLVTPKQKSDSTQKYDPNMPNYISSSPIIKNPLYSTRNKLENNLIYDYKD